MIERHFEGPVCVSCFTFRLQYHARVEMCRAVGAVSRPLMRKNYVRVNAAIEMFRQRLFDALADTVGERRSDLDLLARNPNLHESHVYGILARFGLRAAVSRTLPKKSGGP